LRRGVDRLIIPPPQQHRFAVERLRVPEIVAPPGMRWSVDTRFWRPSEGAGELICCVGREMRDYSTFVEAVRPLGIRCHIAAGGGQGVSNPWLRLDERDLPPSVTLGALSPLELRELYRRSRFVVIPLIPSDTDNGITTALEAFAMGRAVICTDTPGQVGVLEDGVNCLRVPPRDAVALRAAIDRLWADPALCHQLGAAGRALVERNHTIAQWVTAVRTVAEDALTGKGARRP
jgi:glycosyltransferase involved in cell wall biosynthesis